MSMHEIEGLVEDSVHLMARSSFTAAKKRDFIYNLYRFQNRFDTGYTHFRLIAILLELQFTYRILLEEHPDYKKHPDYFKGLNLKKNPWLPSEIGKEEDFVYTKEEETGVFLYVDAGSAFWSRLCRQNILPESQCKCPETFEVGYLIRKLLVEAASQGNKVLLHDWYALFVHLIGYDIGPEEGFSNSFLEFIAHKEIQKIRDIGEKNKLFATAEFHNDWGQLTTPDLEELTKYENNVDRLFCLKWLLDFESGTQRIRDAYAQAVKPDPLKERKLQLVPKAMERHLGTKNWKLVWNGAYEYGHKWLYHHQLRGQVGKTSDTDLHLYLLLDANTEDLKILYPKVGIQNGKLNRWQGREAVHTPECIHFLDPLISFLSDKEYDNNKSLHEMGGWKFNPRNSEKTLEKHVNNLFECFKEYGSKALGEFEKPLFNNFEMSLEEAKQYRERLQQTHRFFLNEIELYLVYGIHEWEQGNKGKAKKLATEAAERAQKKRHPIKGAWLKTAQSILDDRPVLHELLSFERRYSFKEM